MPETTIRDLRATDELRWRELWAGYVKFYRRELTEEITANTWKRLLDKSGTLHGIVAEREECVVGFCNYLLHDTSWSLKPACYMEDLYVDPEVRGSGAAKMLILACEEKAKQFGAFRLYWHTQEFNGAARSLYDTIVPRSSFIVYRKNI